MKIEHVHVQVHAYTHSNAHCKNKMVQHFPLSLIIIFLPMSLVIIQPDLGTSLLIAISGIMVLWFVGLNHKYFFYSFFTAAAACNTDNLCTKNGNSSFLSLKSAAYKQERLQIESGL